jgi:hypothetical protein
MILIGRISNSSVELWGRRDESDYPVLRSAVEFLPKTARALRSAVYQCHELVRRDFVNEADKVIQKGSELASEAYERASTVASDLHDTAKERIGEAVRQMSESQKTRYAHVITKKEMGAQS